MTVELVVDGVARQVADDNQSLLSALRDELGVRSPKDGCSPQGQCGCCTVLVDGAPRVSCVTAVRRVAGRSITTADGLDPAVRGPLVAAMVDHGASQCGFCTPGILCRLAALGPSPSVERVETALLAHLCRCTGWRGVVDAALAWQPEVGGSGLGGASGSRGASAAGGAERGPRELADRRAAIEGRVPQRSGPEAVLGRGGFADDRAPAGALVAVPDGAGGWAVGATAAEARRLAGTRQGRRSGQALQWPVELPAGDWDVVLQTTWVEPGYLEPDASWCEPGGEPAPAAANGGAFGGKARSPLGAAARMLADRHGRAVRVLWSREDVVRQGPKRPPVAVGIRADGTGVLRVARTPALPAGLRPAPIGGAGAALPAGHARCAPMSGVADVVAAFAPGLAVEEVDVAGPPTSVALRASGWAEAAVAYAAVEAVAAGTVGEGRSTVRSPDGATATATVTFDERGAPVGVTVEISCGEILDAAVLRSYATGAAHMALGWVCSEGIAVDAAGVPVDLTIRSFGILRASETPPVDVRLVAGDGPAVNGSDAVFAAVAAATWIGQGLPPRWPTRRAT